MRFIKSLALSCALLTASAAPILMAADSAYARSWGGSRAVSHSYAPARSYGSNSGASRNWSSRNYAPKRGWSSQNYTPKSERSAAPNNSANSYAPRSNYNNGGGWGGWLSHGAAGLAGYVLGSQMAGHNTAAAAPNGYAEGSGGAPVSYSNGSGIGFGGIMLIILIIGGIIYGLMKLAQNNKDRNNGQNGGSGRKW